ncbi:V-type ATP synthase subunit F [Dethiothermospora halolimnae]|uniref:V-type ATP synthase subunit F n=1 Tax=Dethiothermospora halolimnae TaxID=3114390 RepID=UPI003CCBAE6E
MKSFLISDNRDTVVGMRLGGIDGVIVKKRDDILQKLRELVNHKDIGIIIITENIHNKVEDEVMTLKTKRDFPLIVTIPDRHGFGDDSDFITKYIKESIGLNI